jgi:pimeloyl-ACP methyl ester carboxylesterase
VPALIIGAELDDFAPLQLSEDLHAKIPGSVFKVITMSGHFAPSHRSEQVNADIIEFLDQIECDTNG